MASEFEDSVFPYDTAERIKDKFNIEVDNLQDMKEFIYFVNNLSIQECKDLVDELFVQVGV